MHSLLRRVGLARTTRFAFCALAAGGAHSATAQTPVSLTTTDGFRIAALHWAPPGASPETPRPVVLLLHGGGQRKEIWAEYGFVNEFEPDRYHLFAIDIRGHGESDPQPQGGNPGLALNDVEAAFEWLRDRADVDGDRIALVGASYGANISYAGLATRRWRVAGMVALSATMAGFDWFPDEAWRHPIPAAFFIHASNELERYRTFEAMDRLVPMTEGSVFTGTVKGRTHAQGVLRFPEVPPMVRGWLSAILEPGRTGGEPSDTRDLR